MDLFLYGTLRHRPLFDVLAGPATGTPQVQPATLPGHAVDRVADSTLPMLLFRSGAKAEGLLWSGLSTEQRTRLDLYEIAFGYDLRPVTVTLADGTTAQAEAYFPPPGQQSDGTPWDLADWQSSSAAAALLAAHEIDGHIPPLSGPELVRQYPMMLVRAEARLRAAQTPAPATLRHPAAPGDYTVTRRAPLVGDFFKLAQITADHHTFKGGSSGPLRREVLMGCDAALVLPYDAGRDRVLLVEQFRTGPAVRHDPNPWSLEPVAGIVDPGETPAEAGIRETAEEAGLSVTNLTHMFSIYASPGSSTDHFHCYLGDADLPSRDVGFGGLDTEAEDLRLHVLPFDDALALIDSGEVTAGPLVAMLLWLARHRAKQKV